MIPIEYQSFGLAILLGALIGTERQFAAGSAEKYFGGIRTFVFVSLGGAVAAFINDFHVSGFFLLSFAGASVLVLVSHVIAIWRGADEGTTTEIVTPLVFGLGGLCWWQHYSIAISLAIALLFFLSSKRLMHSLTEHLSYEDIRASVTLLVLTFIILPVVPNQGMGPYEALNPYRIWLFVILVGSLSFAAYIALRVFRRTMGVIVTGILGGIVSSTAATMTLSKRSKETPENSDVFSTATIIASSILPLRIFVLSLFVAPQLWQQSIQIAAPGMLIGAIVSINRMRKAGVEHPSLTLNNPYRLKVALSFGFIFAVATLLSRVVVEMAGSGGVLMVAGVSGLVSPDAVVLSLGDYISAGLPDKFLLAGIAISIFANCVLKSVIAFTSGTINYRRWSIPMILIIGTSTLIPLLWLFR